MSLEYRGSTGGGATTTWTYGNSNLPWYPNVTTTNDTFTSGSIYFIPSPSPEVVVAKAKQYIVVRKNGGAVEAAEDTMDDAISAAGRLAAKTGDEYFVFRPGKVVRQKPVDVEIVDP